MFTQPSGVQMRMNLGGAVVSMPVPRGNWKHFSLRADADNLARIFRSIPGVTVEIRDYDPDSAFYTYASADTLNSPRMWQIVGEYKTSENDQNPAVIDEVVGDLWDRRLKADGYVDGNPNSTPGGPYLHIRTFYGDAEASWHKTPMPGLGPVDPVPAFVTPASKAEGLTL